MVIIISKERNVCRKGCWTLCAHTRKERTPNQSIMITKKKQMKTMQGNSTLWSYNIHTCVYSSKKS